MFKMLFGIPNAYILDVTMYKMHVLLCFCCRYYYYYYYTNRLLISKTLTVTYEGGYTYVLQMRNYKALAILIYIVANYKICI